MVVSRGLATKKVLEVTGFDSGAVYMMNRKTGDLELGHAVGLSPEFIEATGLLGSNSPQAQLARSGEPRFMPYVRKGAVYLMFFYSLFFLIVFGSIVLALIVSKFFIFLLLVLLALIALQNEKLRK